MAKPLSVQQQNPQTPTNLTAHFTPAQEFWENELELSINGVLRRLEDPDELQAWIGSRTGRQLDVLCHALNLAKDTRVKDKRAALATSNGQLTSFYLTDYFARRKGHFAIADFATAVLDRGVIALCRGKDGETLDTRALLYALLDADPEYLRTLFHLEKIHKSGFARMELKQKVRQPDTPFETFLTTQQAEQVLKEFDRQKRDQRQCQLKNIVRHHHHHLVFIRRPGRQQYIMRNGRIDHGHEADWIMLDFADNARRVGISPDSSEIPVQIANSLATAYFRKNVQYIDECRITYEQQIHNLLDQLKAGTCEGLKLAHFSVENSSVHGVDLELGHDDLEVVRRAVASLERDHGSLTSRVERITNVKVVYLSKRINVRFEQPGTGQDEYIVRYVQQHLNASLRKRFEDFMRDTHAIPILSNKRSSPPHA